MIYLIATLEIVWLISWFICAYRQGDFDGAWNEISGRWFIMKVRRGEIRHERKMAYYARHGGIKKKPIDLSQYVPKSKVTQDGDRELSEDR